MDNTQNSKNRRGGRPPLPDSERRIVRLQPGFTISETEELEARAEALGVSVPDWLRMAALGQTIKSVPAVNRAAYTELSRLAGTLHQLARQTNFSGSTDGDQLAGTLTETREQVQRLRSELLGG